MLCKDPWGGGALQCRGLIEWDPRGGGAWFELSSSQVFLWGALWGNLKARAKGMRQAPFLLLGALPVG